MVNERRVVRPGAERAKAEVVAVLLRAATAPPASRLRLGSRALLEPKLNHVGYREVKATVSTPGEYRYVGDNLEIYLQNFDYPDMEFRAMPVLIDAFLESVKLLANVANVLVDKLLVGLEVNEERCRELIEQSLMMVTSLAPKIGYEQAAAFAKEAFQSGKTIRQLCRERKVLPDAELDDALDPWKMTEPRDD